MKIRMGHSADPDDAFMAWAIDDGRVDTRGLEIELVPEDVEKLNEWAVEGRLEVTALSMHAYARVRDRYELLPHGASFGDGYGPVVVAPRRLSRDELRGVEIAVPGTMTTAFLVLGMYLGGECAHRVVPFEQILDEVASGGAPAGLVIHEGQLTYPQYGLEKVVDLGEWWRAEKGLPLPLGVVGVRRDLDDGTRAAAAAVFRDSIEAGLANRAEAVEYSLRFGRGLDPSLADAFVRMYVNELTLDMGDKGRRAVDEVLLIVGKSGDFPPGGAQA